MRKLTGAMFASLDGVIQAPGGPSEDTTGGFEHGGWATSYFDETLFGAIGEWFTPPYALLLVALSVPVTLVLFRQSTKAAAL
jgi:hypothetical protein